MTSLGNPLARGTRSVVYEWGASAVAKVPLFSTPEGWIRFEASYASTVSQSGLRVPKVLGIEQINGREVSIFERIAGPTLWDSLLAGQVAPEAAGSLLAELHLQVFAVAPLISLPTQHTRLLTKLRAAHRRQLANGASIESVPVLDTPFVLCHGDFHPKNVIVSAEGPVIVDWFDACRGNAVGDIARTSLLLGGGQNPVEHHLPGASQDVIAVLHRRYLEVVCDSTKITLGSVRQWRTIQQAARNAERTDNQKTLAAIH